MKKLLVLLVFIGSILVGAQLALPQFINHQLEQSIQASFNVDNVKVDATSTPSINMLFGKIANLDADMTGVKLKSGLRFESINLEAKDVQYNVMNMIQGKAISVTSIAKGQVIGIINQQNLNTFLQSKINGLGETSIDIEDNNVLLNGNFNIAGIIKGHASIKGHLLLKGNILIFSPNDFAINGIDIPGLNLSVLNDIKIYDFNKFPIKVTTNRIVADQGRISIYLTPEGI